MNNVIKPNTKIKVLSPEHSKYVQELAFEQGFSWYTGAAQKGMLTHIFFRGNHKMSCLDDGDNYYFDNAIGIKDMTEIFIPLPNPSPKPPFKLRNANHPAVRQWLKDQGYDFWNSDNLNILTTHLDCSFGIVDEDGSFCVLGGEDYFEQEEDFNKHTHPELTLNLAVTSWEMSEPIDKVKLERMKKIEELEKTLAELKGLDDE